MKSLYDAAKDDEQRQAIHKQAENLRNVGNAAGYDLSGYGSGVTFADATQNLATQQARDIAAILSGQGAYSMTSEQYYTDTYYNLLQAGYSPWQARKFAGNRAREYQANHVAYKVEDDERQHRFSFENRADEHKYREVEKDYTDYHSGSGKYKPTEKEQGMFNQFSNLFLQAKGNPTDDNIAAIEQWIFGDENNKSARISLPPDMYSEAKHLPNLLRGLQ